MNDTKRTDSFLDGSPIEVFLSQTDMTVTCRAYLDGDAGDREYDIDSLSMRGAQREISTYLTRQGYVAAGRWKMESDGPRGQEASRKFTAGDE